jgi:arylsulfatase A
MLAQNVSRRNFMGQLGAMSLSAVACGRAKRSPNIIVIYIDDMGYGDIGPFGSTQHRTPVLDQMAAEGMRFTSFYVTSGVCTQSRSSLMTGCYPRRVNMHKDSHEVRNQVLFPVAYKGLHPDEITIADLLKEQGYATACIGKWHLGDQPEFLPRAQGFDYYYGIPYSNDMGVSQKFRQNPPLPLVRNETVIEAPVEQNTLTKRYTEETVKFITEHKEEPFFIYLPHSMVHNPLHASDAFRGKSANNIYGDAVEELDWSTGHILDTLQQLGLDEQTLVIFTSDNGAAQKWGGTNLPLRGHKASTDEGGMREPCIMRWPGHIPAGQTCDEIASTIDLLPTFALLTGTTAPQDRIIDGKDIRPLMFGEAGAESPYEAFYYYKKDQLQAVRAGKWKLHLPLENWLISVGSYETKPSAGALYDLDADIGEAHDVMAEHPDVVARLTALANKARADLGDWHVEGSGQRPAGMVTNPKPLEM